MNETKETRVNSRNLAKEELRKMRGGCIQWSVTEEAHNLRMLLASSGLKLEDIGSSEDELASYVKEGLMNSARNWLSVARENAASQDVAYGVNQVRVRLEQAHLSPFDIGSSEEELGRLLANNKRS